jgi:transposase
VILRREAGQAVFNPAFVAFITHYCCRPVACLPGRAQTSRSK